MIPWWSVFINSLWILGLAVLVSDIGYHYWLAYQAGRTLGQQLRSLEFVRWAWLGLALVGAGLVGTSGRWWEIVLWSLFTLYAVINFLWTLKAHP